MHPAAVANIKKSKYEQYHLDINHYHKFFPYQKRGSFQYFFIFHVLECKECAILTWIKYSNILKLKNRF